MTRRLHGGRLFSLATAVGIGLANTVLAAETPKWGGTLTVATNGQEPACIDPLVNATAGVIAFRPYSDSLVWQTEETVMSYLFETLVGGLLRG